METVPYSSSELVGTGTPFRSRDGRLYLCCASGTLATFSQGMFKTDSLTVYLEDIRQKIQFKKWFFGHYHDNRNVNAKEILLYEQIIRIS